MASDIKKSEWLRCDLFPNKVWSVVRRRATHHVVMELYGRMEQQDANIPVQIEPNLCVWTGRVTHVVPGLVRPNYQGECSFTVHTEDSIVTFFARNEKMMLEWVNLIRRMLPRNDNEYTTGRLAKPPANAAAVSRANNATTNRTTEAPSQYATPNSIADADPHYGHISGTATGANVQTLASVAAPQPNQLTSSSATPPVASESRSASPAAPPPSAQRPKATPKVALEVSSPRPSAASNSTRDPTSPLPPTPDLSESVYGAIYPTQPQRETNPTPPAPANPADSLYGHLSQCSSSENRSGWDKYSQSLLSRVWPLNWWKTAKK